MIQIQITINIDILFTSLCSVTFFFNDYPNTNKLSNIITGSEYPAGYFRFSKSLHNAYNFFLSSLFYLS